MTADRRDAIIRLLRGRDEHLPEPGHRRSEASAGFAHKEPALVSCPDCLANDRTMFGCETCGGRGYTEEKRDRDPYSLSDKVAPFGFDGSRHDASRARDRQIESLKQQLRPASKVDELADANENPYSWERARKRMYRSFDYAALDLALEQLRVADDGASRALHAVYIYAWRSEPAGPLLAACERGLSFLDGRLPEKLRAPAEPGPLVNMAARGRHADKGAMAQRDAEIRRLSQQVPIAELEARFGLKKSALYEIINKEAA